MASHISTSPKMHFIAAHTTRTSVDGFAGCVCLDQLFRAKPCSPPSISNSRHNMHIQSSCHRHQCLVRGGSTQNPCGKLLCLACSYFSNISTSNSGACRAILHGGSLPCARLSANVTTRGSAFQALLPLSGHFWEGCVSPTPCNTEGIDHPALQSDTGVKG